MTDRYGSHPDDYDPPVDLSKPNPPLSYSTPGGSAYPAAVGSGPGNFEGERTSRLAIVGLVISIVSIIFNFLGLGSIAAIIISAVALNRDVKKRGLKGRGLAIAGIILGILGVVLFILLFITVASYLAENCTTSSYGRFVCESSSSGTYNGGFSSR